MTIETAVVGLVAFVAGVIVDHIFGSKVIASLTADVNDAKTRLAALETTIKAKL